MLRHQRDVQPERSATLEAHLQHFSFSPCPQHASARIQLILRFVADKNMNKNVRVE